MHSLLNLVIVVPQKIFLDCTFQYPHFANIPSASLQQHFLTKRKHSALSQLFLIVPSKIFHPFSVFLLHPFSAI